MDQWPIIRVNDYAPTSEEFRRDIYDAWKALLAAPKEKNK